MSKNYQFGWFGDKDNQWKCYRENSICWTLVGVKNGVVFKANFPEPEMPAPNLIQNFFSDIPAINL